jgi:hypothetical protein
MRRQWKVLTVATALLAIAGCSGMSASECELADWRAVGYEDGSRGRSSEVFASHRKNCAKHDVAPDFAAYQSGRESGLREYCQPAKGFREGARGAEYVGVCPADLENAFLDGYYEGRTLYQLEYAVNSTTRQIEARQSRMKRIEIELTEVMAAALANDLPGDQRASLLVQTKQLAEERITLANEVDDLQLQLQTQQEELAAHRSQMVTRL